MAEGGKHDIGVLAIIARQGPQDGSDMQFWGRLGEVKLGDGLVTRYVFYLGLIPGESGVGAFGDIFDIWMFRSLSGGGER
jgi:hypothetical protein